MKKTSTSLAETRLSSLLIDPSYDERQLGSVIRLMLATGEENLDAGRVEGYNAGYPDGHEDGSEDGFEAGFEAGYDHAFVKNVFVALWADETQAADLGTTLRIVGAATTRDRALEMANAYREAKGTGDIFVFSFRLQHVEV